MFSNQLETHGLQNMQKYAAEVNDFSVLKEPQQMQKQCRPITKLLLPYWCWVSSAPLLNVAYY